MRANLLKSKVAVTKRQKDPPINLMIICKHCCIWKWVIIKQVKNTYSGHRFGILDLDFEFKYARIWTWI